MTYDVMNPASHSNQILITGIAGFTGQYLERYLSERGYDVYGTTIDRTEKTNYFECDLGNIEALKSVIHQVKPIYVIHLAAISFVGESNASLMYDVNVIGTCNLLESLLTLPQAPQKVIVASSATVYGDQGSEVLYESMCPRPLNHYGCSKYAMECMVSTYMSRLPIIITRPFNYTGSGQEIHFLIPKIVSHFQECQSKIELGNLNVEREFNDILDVCEIYSRLLVSDIQSDTVNLCTGRGISLLDVIKLMNVIAGYEIEVSVNPMFVRENEIKRLVGSTEKLENIIGKMDPIDFKTTLYTMYNNNNESKVKRLDGDK